MSNVRTQIDPSLFTEPGAAMDLYHKSIRAALPYDAFGGKTRFLANVISTPIKVASGGTTGGNWSFRARIIEDPSPHWFIPNPCNEATAGNDKENQKLIALHTSFVGVGDGTPAYGDMVIVELERNTFSYNLQHGKFIRVVNNPAAAPEYQWTSCIGNCERLAETFDEKEDAEEAPLPAEQQPYRGTFEDLKLLIPAFGPLLKKIAESESGGAGYEAVNRGCSGDSPGGAQRYTGKKLVDMSLAELESYMKGGAHASKVGRAKNCRSTKGDGFLATGKYQIIPKTLREIVKSIKEMPDLATLKYNETTQDTLAVGLLLIKRPTLGNYLLGKHDEVIAAGQDLAHEWASIPLQKNKGKCKRGQSAYCGDSAGNAASGSPESYLNLLKASKKLATASPLVKAAAGSA